MNTKNAGALSTRCIINRVPREGAQPQLDLKRVFARMFDLPYDRFGL